ncbi:apiosidase-like domain-containing protein [Reichenbachiella versicolor]|uniref:apiosidase-like domain-containing protein n=1 Tax=Reichenbachiella versicolor TaxID=1821036 RepID=UPI000D6EADDA|nr:DUF4038 domain-containing protein [Reichenbachiella versicolor]
MNKAFLLGLLLIASLALTAQPKVWKSPRSVTSAQWEVNDLTYTVKQKFDKPFLQEAFAIVKDEVGEQRIPLFYNGGDQWVFRYSSATIGKKTFVVESDIKELNGKKGKITITKNAKTDRHGGIVLKDKDPNHFYYEDGKHYFNLAFECDWLFALDYGQQEIPKTKHLLSLLNKHKLNQIVMNVYSYDVKWPKDPKLADHPEHEYGEREDIFPFLGSNSDPDFSSLNVDFFKHFDKVIAEMHDQEIVSHLMIYVWNKEVNWPDMESEADNMYYDYVVKRYQAYPNIIWDVSKEALHYTRATKEYILERVERTRKVDSYNRLVSVHDYGFCRNNADKVDFISMQNWKHTLYQTMLTAAKDFPNKPIFNIEHGGYEESPYVVFPGAYVNAETCLRRNYMCLFAGGYTTYYWQGASWNVLIHNPFEQPTDFPKPKFEYFTHMATFFDQFDFSKFKPWEQANSAGYNLTNEEDGIMLTYTPKENQWVGLGAAKKKFDTSNVTRQWFNTQTGEFSKEEPYDTKKHGFWDDRPWKYEADAIMIVRGLKKK